MHISERLQYIDFASGIMILWMLLFHAVAHTWDFYPCILFPYLHFFMPWFFYKSGQFFQKRKIGELIIKDSKKLLKNFLFWSVVGAFCYFLICLFNHSLSLSFFYSIARELFFFGKVPINTPLWFLLTLFLVRFVANVLIPNKEDHLIGWKIVGIILFGYSLAYLAYKNQHNILPYWFGNGAAGLCFFTLGYAFSELEKNNWLVMISAIVFVVCCVVGFPMVDMFSNKLIYGNYLLWIPVSFCNIISFNALCRYIYKYIRIKPIEWIGKNAMIIYVTHILIVKLIVEFIIYNDINFVSLGRLCLILLAYMIILPIFYILHSIDLINYK